MRDFFGFIVDPRGRTDRLGYIAGLFGLLLWVLLLTTLFRARLDDFTGSGMLADAVWTGRVGEFWRLLFLPRISLHPIMAVVLCALYLLALWSFLSLTARRLQDMGRPGIYAAATLIVGVQAAVLLLAILPGDREENTYGPAPRRRFSRGSATNPA